MSKKTITVVILGLIMAGTAYLAYNTINGLEDFDFSDPFDDELDNE